MTQLIQGPPCQFIPGRPSTSAPSGLMLPPQQGQLCIQHGGHPHKQAESIEGWCFCCTLVCWVTLQLAHQQALCSNPSHPPRLQSVASGGAWLKCVLAKFHLHLQKRGALKRETDSHTHSCMQQKDTKNDNGWHSLLVAPGPIQFVCKARAPIV